MIKINDLHLGNLWKKAERKYYGDLLNIEIYYDKAKYSIHIVADEGEGIFLEDESYINLFRRAHKELDKLPDFIELEK